MRWILRVVLLFVILIVLVGLFRNHWLTRAKSVVVGPPEKSDNRSGSAGEEANQVRPFEDRESGNDNVDDSPGLKHPITRALGQALEGQQDRLGDDGEDIQRSLLEADEILWREKLRGREAIRQANRQVRLPGRSPNVLLIVCEGLRTSDVGCYTWTKTRSETSDRQGVPAVEPSEPPENRGPGTDFIRTQPPEAGHETDSSPSPTPNLDQLAAQGLRLTELRSDGVAKDQRSLLTGRNSSGPDPPQLDAREFTFSRVLWQAGYTTAVIGDCWWWGVAIDDFDLDAWFGFRAARETSQAFPEEVWSSGRQIRLKANADGARVLGAQDLFVKEANAYLSRNRRGRPFMLCVSLSLASTDERDAASIKTLDNNVGQIVDHLDQLGLGGNTLLIVIGTSPTENSETFAPAIVRWTGRIRAGTVFNEKVDFADILPTVTDAVQALRRPRNLDGSSRLGAWLAVEVGSVKPEL